MNIKEDNCCIAAFNTDHDSGAVLISNGKLIASIEGEKDSRERFYVDITFSDVIDLYSRIQSLCSVQPDVIALIGDYHKTPPKGPYGQYHGITLPIYKKGNFFGQGVDFFASTHERAHIFCAYALSPFEQGKPVYCLDWEGGLGKFYEVDENLNISIKADIIRNLGLKYKFLYVLAGGTDYIHHNTPGKSMALAAYAREKNVKKYEAPILELLFDINDYQLINDRYLELKEILREKYGDLVPYNAGVESRHYKEFSYAFQEIAFNEFYQYAKKNMNKKWPLLITGGCGLNCTWNKKWYESGLFEDIFIPPCPNDSGIAIGLAAEARFFKTGRAKLEWDVYAGEAFVSDETDESGFYRQPLDYDAIADFLIKDKVIAWIQGKYEIGPRALCHRSLIAAPFKAGLTQRLNDIKERESFRPVAPVCIEEKVGEFFDWTGPSPYMLYFQNVKSDKLKAITHVDNSARVQTVNKNQNEPIYELLKAFERKTGYPVLCNTSLNFSGMGFINRKSHMFKFARERGLDGFVIEDRFYKRKDSKTDK